MADMQAVVVETWGPPEVLHLAEVPRPDPAPTEVLVRTRAVGVNPVDWKTRSGAGMSAFFGPAPRIIGWDVAGVVEAVGLGVSRFSVGDEVLGMPHFPRPASAYAEYVVAPSRQLVRKPPQLSDVVAGALPLAFLTAYQTVVEVAAVQPGMRVLIHAAAGGVGHLAVQIARANGAEVIATASAAKHDRLASLGVAETIDYRTFDFTKACRDLDVVIDLVGGELSIRSLDVLAPGGLLVSVPSRLPEGLFEAAKEKGVRASGVVVEPDQIGLDALGGFVDAGLQVWIEATFPLADAADAHRHGEAGASTGKIVLTV
jgi:NADPH:quinone reductase-like Zn-dependent oxidoreductase